MPNGNGIKAWALTAFLAGIVVAGLAGVVRGDWLGDEAAEHVREEITVYHDKDVDHLKEGQERIEAKLDELLRIQR